MLFCLSHRDKRVEKMNLLHFLILELPESSTDLKAWSFQLRKNYFCMLNFDRPIAHQSSITFYRYTLYIDNTFRACGKDSPYKKPRARLNLHHN